MSKRTLFLIFALFLITFVLLLVAFYQPQTSKTAPAVTAPKKLVAQAILSFGTPVIATSSPTLIPEHSLPVEISTGGNKVTAVQLELQYDPQVLTSVTVAPGPFFGTTSDVLLNQIDAETGRISYALSVGLTAQGVTGRGIVATVTFSSKVKTPGKTAILFLPKTLVTASGINESVLKQTTNGLFMLGENPSTSSAQ